MKLNIIKGNRTERHDRLTREVRAQGVESIRYWDGIYMPSVKASINAAHKQIIRYAKLAEWDRVAVAEDDIRFSAPGAWQYYLEQMPSDFDIYLGMVYLGEPDHNGLVESFTGMTLYTVHQRFYDKFISVPDHDHIDRLMSGLGRFVVCSPFVCDQYDGHSSNTGKYEEYGPLTRNRQFFLGH